MPWQCLCRLSTKNHRQIEANPLVPGRGHLWKNKPNPAMPPFIMPLPKPATPKSPSASSSFFLLLLCPPLPRPGKGGRRRAMRRPERRFNLRGICHSPIFQTRRSPMCSRLAFPPQAAVVVWWRLAVTPKPQRLVVFFLSFHVFCSVRVIPLPLVPAPLPPKKIFPPPRVRHRRKSWNAWKARRAKRCRSSATTSVTSSGSM
jgi:hypothetical protein